MQDLTVQAALTPIPEGEPTLPAMSPADIAAHQAATHTRAARTTPLPPAAQAALACLTHALTPAATR